MEHRQAAAQIDAIWAHIARTERFRGYRPTVVALTGVMGLFAAAFQSLFVSNPAADWDGYLALWCGTAIVCVLVVGGGLLGGYLRSDSSVDRQLTRQAVQQFLPCLIAGVLVTWLIADHHPEKRELLPALWAVCFSLGIFASLPYVTPHVVWVAVYYLVAGGVALVWGRGDRGLSPWLMAITFGVGQLLMALLLFHGERDTDDEV